MTFQQSTICLLFDRHYNNNFSANTYLIYVRINIILAYKFVKFIMNET